MQIKFAKRIWSALKAGMRRLLQMKLSNGTHVQLGLAMAFWYVLCCNSSGGRSNVIKLCVVHVGTHRLNRGIGDHLCL